MLASRRSYRLVFCALVAAALYLPGLGRPALWEPDEGRYAEIAREMVASGDYVTPRNDFELYFEKPPLVYWCEAAAIHLLGPTEFAVRLPAALFTIGQVVVTAAIADAMFGASAGILAAMVLALSPLVFAFARFATLDPALAFFLTAAMGAFLAAARKDDLASRAARPWNLLCSTMLALATLVKGPVALVLGAAIAGIWLVSEARARDLFRVRLLGYALIYVAIVAPWFVLAELRNPGFLRFFFIHEHVQRFVSSREHGWGPWFFIPVVIGGMWPWIFFAPLGWSKLRADDTTHSFANRSNARFLLIWFAVIFVFFSIPRSKLGTYILPAMPPLAIFAGYWLSRLSFVSADRRDRVLKYFAVTNVAFCAIAAAVVFAIAPTAQRSLALDAAFIATLVGVGAILMYALCRDALRVPFGIAAMALAMVATTSLAEVARRHAAPLNTYRNLAHAVQPYLADDCVLASYRHYIQSLPFYTHRRETRAVYWGELSEVPAPSPSNVKSIFLIGSDARLRQLWASSACFILIANNRDLPALNRLLAPVPTIVGCEGKKFALINRTPHTSSPSSPASSPCKGED